MQPVPARVGDPVEAVETPALVIDLDALEQNLDRMAAVFPAGGRVALRPHAKTHKSAAVAAAQIARGAVGICCQKVGEAEALVEAGIGDILISNEIVGPGKLRRLAQLAGRATIEVCADNAGNIEALNEAAGAAGTVLSVRVEIDVGQARCGVVPGLPALLLAQAIDREPNLRFSGLQAYHGGAQHTRSPTERRAKIAEAAERVAATIALLDQAGLHPATVGGAGTGTYLLEQAAEIWNEAQPGSYVFLDADYMRNEEPPAFRHALFVLATVMSTAKPGHAILDAGLKASSMDSGMPLLADLPGAVFVSASDEHGVVALGETRLAVGDRIRLIPGHCDPTVNLYDWLVGVRDGRVETVWPIEARGAVS
jgi:D-serine deaminase-like pyridoxal phosphate-dependent protein